MKKVIITGSTGMIGISLIEYLLKNNIKVLAIIRPNSLRKNDIPLNKNVEILECNLNDLKHINIEESDYDVFYHFGWEGTFGDDRNNREKQQKNVEYTCDAVKLAKRIGCKKFIGAGSQAEFGLVNGIINEKTDVKPETEYGKAKYKAGLDSKKIADTLNINHIWTRIFSVYGPFDGKQTMIMTSIKEMINGNSPKYTKGEQIWDYLFSEDLAKMLFLLGSINVNNTTYCLASGNSRKLFEYIEIIKRIINPQINLKLGAIPYSEKQVMNLNVDINKFVKETGYIPETSFEDGIQKTIDWYKKHEGR